MNVKATMIGAGIAPIVAKPAAAAPATAAAPTPAAAPTAAAVAAPRQVDQPPIALAQTQALFAPPAAAAAAHHSALEQPKYLPGDPMAPQPIAARQPAPRLMDVDETPIATPMKDRKWMFLAVGGVVLFSVLMLVVGLMH